jgi:hypothetical protein
MVPISYTGVDLFLSSRPRAAATTVPVALMVGKTGSEH